MPSTHVCTDSMTTLPRRRCICLLHDDWTAKYILDAAAVYSASAVCHTTLTAPATKFTFGPAY